MAKGKYAARSANRRAMAEAEATTETYQRRVRELTEERNKLRVDLEHEQAERRKEVRILRAQLNEGTSPRVEALTRDLNRVREDRDRLRREVREYVEAQELIGRRVAEHFIAEHGCTWEIAVDSTNKIFPARDHGLIIKGLGR